MRSCILKNTLVFAALILIYGTLSGSCFCDNNCPMTMPHVGPFSSSITVSGATNDMLGSNGQRVIGVNMHFNHDAVNELDVILVAPDGSSVELMSNYHLEWNLDQDFAICFIACDMVAQPDPGFPAVIDTWLMSQAGVGYSFEGSYYPSVGCLENLTGPVNGTWTLDMEDFVGVMGGTLFEWSLVFEDNDGTMCPEPCEPPVFCLADGGDLSDAAGIYCEGSPDLFLSPVVSHPNSPPNPDNYGYTFVVADENGVVLEYSENPDLTSYSPGIYEVCGLSYLLEDYDNIPQPNGIYTTTDIENDIDNEIFCADLTEDCEEVMIEPALGLIEITGPIEVCPDEPETYVIENLDLDSDFNITIDGAYSELTITEDTILNIIWEDEPGPRLICADHSNICGTESFCLNIEVFEVPEIQIVGPGELCPGETGVYEFFPAPDPGEFYDIDVIGGVITAQGASYVEIEWYENNNFNYLTVEVIGADCPHPEPETFQVILIEYDLPQFFDYSSELCEDGTGWAEIFSDPNVQTYSWYGDGITIEQGQGTSGPVIFTPEESGLATLCLEMEATCGPEDHICQDIIVLEVPDPPIEPVDPQCQFEFTLSAEMSPNHFGSWEQTDGPEIASIQNPFSPTTFVEVPEPGIYFFEFTEDNGFCVGTSLIEIEILPGLNIESVVHQCIFDEYFVVLEISGGELPYSVNGEVINGTTFESELIPEGDTYHFQITDVSGCETEITDTHECPCQIDPGSMSGEPIEICIDSDQPFTATYNNDGTMGPNDIGVYILHDNSGSTIGEIFDLNDSGTFELQAEMEAGQTYYISFVIGPEENGEINLDGDCVTVALGQPVVVYGLPVFALPGRIESCLYSTEISIASAQSSGVLELLDNTGDTEVDWTVEGVGEFYLTAEEATELLLSYSEQNGPCSRTDTLEVEFFDLPEFSTPVVHCIGEEFFVTFEITGGSPPYYLNNNELSESNFSSHTVPTGTTFEYIVRDENDCYADTFSITGDCQCLANAGTIIESEISLCTEDPLLPGELMISDTILDEGDELFFVLHDGSPSEIGDILVISSGEEIPFPNDAQLGEVLYLSLVVGQSINDLPDWSDPCLHTSAGIPVVWEEGPVLSFEGQETSCTGDSVELVIVTEGNFPFQLDLISNTGRIESTEITEEVHSIRIEVLSGEEIWEISAVHSECPAEFSGQFEITGRDELEISLEVPPEVCNNTFFGSELNLNSILSDDSIEGEWLNEDGEVVSPMIDFDGYEAGDYHYTFSTIGFEDPCPGQMLETTITVLHCECPEVVITDTVGLCGSESVLDLNELIESQEEGRWEITSMEAEEPVPFIQDNQLIIEPDKGGTVDLTYRLIDSFPPACQTEFHTHVFIDFVRNSGLGSVSEPYCEDEEDSIQLVELLEGNQEDGQWLYEGELVQQSVELKDLTPGEHHYFYALESGPHCPGDTTGVTIDIRPTPTFDIEVNHLSCYGFDDGSIIIIPPDEPDEEYQFVFEGEIVGDHFFSDLAPGTYDLNLINSHGCEGDAVVAEVIEPEEITVDLGQDLEGNFNDLIRLVFSTNAEPEEIESITWTANGQIEEVNEIEFTFPLQGHTEVEVAIRTINGCGAVDLVNVILREQSVYLPNVFRPGSRVQANSVFGPLGTQIVEEIVLFRIFDRWGNKLFNIEDVTPDLEMHFWDGKADGDFLNPGTYIYHLLYRDFRGEEHQLSGEFTLLR